MRVHAPTRPAPTASAPSVLSAVVLGLVLAQSAHADIFGKVDSTGVIVLTDMPGKTGMSVIVASPPSPGRAKQPLQSTHADAAQFEPVIVEASETFHLQPELLRAVIDVESSAGVQARLRELTAEAVSKGDYDSFMSKEIAEQPQLLDGACRPT